MKNNRKKRVCKKSANKQVFKTDSIKEQLQKILAKITKALSQESAMNVTHHRTDEWDLELHNLTQEKDAPKKDIEKFQDYLEEMCHWLGSNISNPKDKCPVAQAEQFRQGFQSIIDGIAE